MKELEKQIYEPYFEEGKNTEDYIKDIISNHQMLPKEEQEALLEICNIANMPELLINNKLDFNTIINVMIYAPQELNETIIKKIKKAIEAPQATESMEYKYEYSQYKQIKNIVRNNQNLNQISDFDKTKAKDISATKLIEELEKVINYRIAKYELIMHNLRLITSTTKKYTDRETLEDTDLFQEGVIGLIKGIEKLDRTKSNTLSTYTLYWIRQTMTRALQDQDRIIRNPVHSYEFATKVIRARQELTQELEREPKDKEIAEYLGIELQEYFKNLELFNRTRVESLDVPKYNLNFETDGEMELIDFIADEETLSPEEELLSQFKYDELNMIIDAEGILDERQRKIVRMYFGFYNNGEQQTLAQVGKELGLTRERVRQILDKSLIKIRAAVQRRKRGIKLEKPSSKKLVKEKK